jgi:hypothetical protein
MSKAMRTTVCVAVSLVLSGVLAMAQTSGNNVDKDQNKEHHSRFSKVAFWHRHKDADKNAKQSETTKTPSRQTQVKQTQVKTAQVKPVPAKPASGKSQNQAQHATNMKKVSTKKPASANKTKAQQKAQDPKTVSLKQ